MKIRFTRDTDLVDGNFDDVYYPKGTELEVRDLHDDPTFGGDMSVCIRDEDSTELILMKENYEVVS